MTSNNNLNKRLRIEYLVALSGELLNGFFVRNGEGKAVAIGAMGSDGFVMPTRKRYARDITLCYALRALTDQPVKWNCSVYGNVITSRGNAKKLFQKYSK